MFQTYYHMNGPPFRRDTSTEAIYRHGHFEEAVSRLRYAAEGHGFAVITGPCGTGKTTLLRCVCTQLAQDRYKVIYLSDSALSPTAFYRRSLQSLGVAPKRSACDAKGQLESTLKNLPGYTGMQPVFVLDEAHMFTTDMLQEVRFILNSDYDSQSSAGLILCGQDELLEKLRFTQLTAIRQRVDVLCTLKPLNREETQTYIEHHLSIVGVSRPLFSDHAIDVIYDASGGIPRVIDKICTNVLILGCQENRQILDDNQVALVVENELLH